ncbi:hypothetical protein AAEX28_03940 [Lentisphaerota bacterium WC36G]|nr:hypothetical protein LJT99_06815 [Lentisphaerae bacterium WC36]
MNHILFLRKYFLNLFLLIFANLCIIAVLANEENGTYIVKDENKLKKIKIPKSQEDNCEKVDFSENNFSDGTDDSKLYWKPRWLTHGVSSLALTDTQIIGEKIYFVEKAGKQNAAQGALVVVYNYKSSEFENILKISSHQIIKFCISADGEILYAITKAQEKLNQQFDEVIAIDLVDGEIIGSLKLKNINYNFKDIAISEDNVVASYFDSKKEKISLIIYDKNLTTQQKLIKTDFTDGVLVATKDNQCLFLNKNNGLLIDCNKLIIDKSKSVKFNFLSGINEAVYCKNINSVLILTHIGTLSNLINSTPLKNIKIYQNVAAEFFYNEELGLVSLFDLKKKTLTLIDVKNYFKEKYKVKIKSLKPKDSKGSRVLWSKVITSSPLKILVFTSYGALYTVNGTKKRNRYTKQVLIEPVQ